MIFYLGTHMVNHAKHFNTSFISVNVLRKRVSNFVVNDWILDSGAFSELSLYGHYRFPVSEYANQINRWKLCGNLITAVCQDYMCEPFMLEKTGLTIKEHQQLTIERYDELVNLTDVTIMPVLQGYEPKDYINHLDMYGDRLTNGLRVGVGSVCKRNGNPNAIVAVLETIKKVRPDLRLHGFGLKTTALRNNYITSLLDSADSMAWSYAARKQGGNRNGLQEALDFTEKIKSISGKREHQFSMGYILQRVARSRRIEWKLRIQ